MNNINQPHICYFPTLTIFIDDKQEFLDSITLKLDKKSQSYKFFANARQAIEYIKTNYKKSQWFYNHIKNLEEEKEDHKVIELNIHDIYKQIYNKDRFDIITSVIIDYDMPEINGLDVAKELHDLDLSKILLTGAADEKLAVDAFNNKLIDGFITKSSETIYQEISAKIKEGADSYFREVSKILSPYATKENDINISNPQFMQLFNTIISEKNIIEYYMTESALSYLFLNNHGRVDMLFLFPDKHLDSIYQIAKEENISKSILNQLESKQKILCFYDFKESIFSFSDSYEQYLIDAKKIVLDGVDHYYGYKENILDEEKVISFYKFNNR
jgi:CheY-like chemotaxis protein